ncbi:MAG: BrnT family toxin [Alphaproteobacteria bacterium]|nr:BrnT family toxin [Alphaproteobacteria bacterium]
MKLTWDEAKRRQTLAERGLDFADVASLFAGEHFTRVDDRVAYGEPRFITAGYVKRRLVVVVWTPRDGGRRIMSMRHGHGKEEARYRRHME